MYIRCFTSQMEPVLHEDLSRINSITNSSKVCHFLSPGSLNTAKTSQSHRLICYLFIYVIFAVLHSFPIHHCLSTMPFLNNCPPKVWGPGWYSAWISPEDSSSNPCSAMKLYMLLLKVAQYINVGKGFIYTHAVQRNVLYFPLSLSYMSICLKHYDNIGILPTKKMPSRTQNKSPSWLCPPLRFHLSIGMPFHSKKGISFQAIHWLPYPFPYRKLLSPSIPSFETWMDHS